MQTIKIGWSRDCGVYAGKISTGICFVATVPEVCDQHVSHTNLIGVISKQNTKLVVVYVCRGTGIVTPNKRCVHNTWVRISGQGFAGIDTRATSVPGGIRIMNNHQIFDQTSEIPVPDAVSTCAGRKNPGQSWIAIEDVQAISCRVMRLYKGQSGSAVNTV